MRLLAKVYSCINPKCNDKRKTLETLSVSAYTRNPDCITCGRALELYADYYYDITFPSGNAMLDKKETRVYRTETKQDIITRYRITRKEE